MFRFSIYSNLYFYLKNLKNFMNFCLFCLRYKLYEPYELFIEQDARSAAYFALPDVVWHEIYPTYQNRTHGVWPILLCQT